LKAADALIEAGFRLLGRLPPRWLGACGALLGRLSWHLLRRYRGIALRNLARAFPDRSRAERARLGKEAFAELGRTIFELPCVYTRSKRWLLARIEVEGIEAVQRALAEGTPVVLCAMHYDNWELGALALSMLGLPVHIPYRPLNQAALDRRLFAWRTRFGARFHPRSAGVRPLLRALRQKEAVALMIDQHVPGHPVPFLGHLALTTPAPVLLVRRAKAKPFAVCIFRKGKGFRFRLTFEPLKLPGDEIDSLHAINRRFSAIIQQRPAPWLWAHRRWLWLESASPKAAEMVDGAI